jgi:hypothetical protein
VIVNWAALRVLTGACEIVKQHMPDAAAAAAARHVGGEGDIEPALRDEVDILDGLVVALVGAADSRDDLQAVDERNACALCDGQPWQQRNGREGRREAQDLNGARHRSPRTSSRGSMR